MELGELKEKAMKCELLPESDIKNICDKVRELFAKEDNVVSVSTPVTIAGDIHGQFHDLLQLFITGGDFSNSKYLFLGDYVDRGRHSVQVITLLFLLKIEYPDKMILLRGNHEARCQTQVFGFYDECLMKYGDSKVWRLFMETFDYLPVAAVVDNKLFCCHGGLSPSAPDIDSIQGLDRVKELSDVGALADIAWSDPDEDHLGWEPSPRGAGWTFGEDVVEAWNMKNGLEILVRGHQMVDDGFCWNHSRQTLTLFSAPNYMYRCGNTAAILQIQPNIRNLHFKQFVSTVTQPDLTSPSSNNHTSTSPMINKYFL